MLSNAIQDCLALLAENKNLTQDMATRAFQIIMNGGATPAHMAAFLMGLRMKGETTDEITAGAIVMRAKAKRINVPEGCIDTCGTGGDAKGTYNISTAVAFVLAACGVPVAKHGNRSVSSKSGSADVLEQLSIKIDAEVPVLERCLKECNIAFLMAPVFHTATRHVAPVRRELAIRTVFNLLGPLSNPAAPDYQLMGVYSAELIEPMAHVLKELGTKSAWVVHGSDGLDELTLTGPSKIAELKDGEVRIFELTPEDAGLPTASLEELRGKDPEHNAAALRDALSGMESAYRNAVVLNAAGGLVITGKAPDIKAGVSMAQEAIDSGGAHGILNKLILLSNEKIT
ncbi:MAG: anthranilate phosphoribosyltransferase [Rickettsiales bacterium]